MTSLPASNPGSPAVWGSKRINSRPQSCLCLAWSGYPSNDDDERKVPSNWRAEDLNNPHVLTNLIYYQSELLNV